MLMSARIILIFSLLQSYLVAQPFYFEQSDSMGVDFSALGGYGNGVSTYDWDRDGFDDLTLLKDGSLPRFYHNEAGITFSQVEFQGIDVTDNQKSVNWVDFNNDGFPDLSFNSFQGGMRLYLNQGDFTFINITASSGVEQNAADWGYGHSWADYDRDGFLDLFVANYNIESTEIRPNHLYHNNGNNTFTDVTSVMGLGNIEEATFMGVWFDYNNDGYNDSWRIENIQLFPSNRVLIVNRWGDVVYQSDFYNNDWDGSFGGGLLPAGTYYYVLDLGQGWGIFKGDVTIIRK
jgi:gliding motility-associated-like protein